LDGEAEEDEADADDVEDLAGDEGFNMCRWRTTPPAKNVSTPRRALRLRSWIAYMNEESSASLLIRSVSISLTQLRPDFDWDA
jgi:hypothetical protein